MSSTSPKAKLPPTPMASTPAPNLGTQRISKQRYLDPAYAELEHRHLWNRVWLLAGFESDLPESGDIVHVVLLDIRAREVLDRPFEDEIVEFCG